MIIWLPERVSDTVHLIVAPQLPGELWGVTPSPSFLFLASNELWLTDKSQCRYSLVERLENLKAWIQVQSLTSCMSLNKPLACLTPHGVGMLMGILFFLLRIIIILHRMTESDLKALKH